MTIVQFKLRKIGHSVGVLIPRDVLAASRPRGHPLSHGGSRRIPSHLYDPEFEQQMTLAREIMKGDRNMLRELADK
jgi:hypothetical protein